MNELFSLTKQYGQTAYEGYALLVHSWATNNQNFEQQSAVIQILEKMRCRIALPMYASMSADIQAERGDYASALKQINHCIELCDKYEERAYEPELHLRRGQFLSKVRPKAVEAIRQTFSKALEMAQVHGMVSTIKAAQQALGQCDNV